MVIKVNKIVSNGYNQIIDIPRGRDALLTDSVSETYWHAVVCEEGNLRLRKKFIGVDRKPP